MNNSEMSGFPQLQLEFISYGSCEGGLKEDVDFNLALPHLSSDHISIDDWYWPELGETMIENYDIVNKLVVSYLEDIISKKHPKSLIVGISCLTGQKWSAQIVEKLTKELQGELLQGTRIVVSKKHRDVDRASIPRVPKPKVRKRRRGKRIQHTH